MTSLAQIDDLAVVAAHRAPPPRVRSLEKVALVLLAVSRPVAQQLLKFFDPVELEAIKAYASQLKAVNSGDLSNVIAEFERSFKAGARFVGTSDEINELLASATEPDFADIPIADDGTAEIEQPSVWPLVEGIGIEILRAFVVSQHPQVGAFVLGKLRTELAAEVLMPLEASDRNELLMRMIDIEDASGVSAEVIESVVRQQLLEKTSGDRKSVLSSLAGVLNRLERAQVDEVLGQLAQASPQDAQAIRKMLFSFDDLIRLPKKSLAMAVDNAPPDKLVRALVGTSDKFMETVLGVLSPRARRMVESELKSVGSLTSKDVDSARREIAAGVLALAASGSIELVQDTNDQ